MKNKIFYTDKGGITSTSANHIANIAKEYIEELKSKISNIQLFDIYVKLISESGNGNILTNAITKDEFEHIPQLLQDIGEANALIAWLREAIKDKDEKIRNLNHLSFDSYVELKNITIKNSEPFAEERPTMESLIDNLNEKERAKYYASQAIASTYGNYVHTHGDLSRIRRDYQKRIQEPNYVTGEGRDTLLYSSNTNFTSEDVENQFFNLQAKHREFQAQYNSIHYKLVDELNNATETYKRRYEKYINIRNRDIERVENEREIYIQSELKRVGDLKITIPERFNSIYEKINNIVKPK